MTSVQITYLIELLTSTGVHFDNGLTDDEIASISAKFDVEFPPDLRALLQAALPISESFVNWRLGLNSQLESEAIQEILRWPLEGMLFDLRSNAFWMEGWGQRPDNYVDQEKIAKGFYNSYPKLVPIYSHRYIPSKPSEHNNPIYSVHQMDIIYYGYNLATYLAKEFHFELPSIFERFENPKDIEFWSECAG